MFSRIRERFTFANVAMTLALVFAMTGGAYAAKRYLITSTSQIKPGVLAQLKGKSGPAGAQGSQGAQGAQGPQGPAGTNGVNGEKGAGGTNGTNGKSVIVENEPTKTANCAGLGGASFHAEGSTAKQYACNGQTGYTEKLPAGKTETGTWVVQTTSSAEFELRETAISFPIPLSAPIEDSTNITFVKSKEALPAGCKGSVTEPGAEAGRLCIFEGETPIPAKPGLGFYSVLAPGAAGTEKTGAAGAELVFYTEKPKTVGEEVAARGTWAVTAAE